MRGKLPVVAFEESTFSIWLSIIYCTMDNRSTFLSALHKENMFIVYNKEYRKISNIRCTKSPNLNVSRLLLQLPLPNPMKPGVKSRMKM